MNQNIKVAVITGGSRGLGRSTVINLAQRGIHSIFTYKSGQQEAAEVVKEAEKAGAKAIALYLDTANIAGFDDLLHKCKKLCENSILISLIISLITQVFPTTRHLCK